VILLPYGDAAALRERIVWALAERFGAELRA
jgi:hypothetical protein